MGTAGKERVSQRFSWGGAAAKTKQIYEQVLSQ
jgi:hypothetical protein